VGCVFDGGTEALTAGLRVEVIAPFAFTLRRWTILLDAVGSCTVDIRSSTFDNWAGGGDELPDPLPGLGNEPSVSSNSKATGNTNAWEDKELAEQEIVQFRLDAVSGGVKRISVMLDGVKI
jgi:hypothetical protein